MRKAALYARVSTQLQEKERTIDSQLAELRRQIAKNGDELIKEYIDDGYSGAYLDRPAMEEMRQALKTDTFEVIYFHAADRIARKSLHQDIIISDILRHKKRVIISDKDYEKNPENEFALKVFGAVSEFERAKIVERTQRGRLHKLRQGVVPAHGLLIFGYDYVRLTPTTPPGYVINEKEAATVRYIFENYANGVMGGNEICRTLEQKNIPTSMGKPLWSAPYISRMLKNTAYTGTRYYNRTTQEEPPADGTYKKRRKTVMRDRSEWIAIKMPPIISQKLFNKAQERMVKAQEKYRRPNVPFLLSRFLKCGECGKAYSSVRWRGKKVMANGEIRTQHFPYYQCNTMIGLPMHDRTKVKSCRNPKITPHFVDDKVIEIIENVMFEPDKLLRFTDKSDYVPDAHTPVELERLAERMKRLNETRRKVIDGYMLRRISTRQYTERSRNIDQERKRLTEEKDKVVSASYNHHGMLNTSLKQFCVSAKAKYETCVDLGTRREFLKNHIEKVIFFYGKVTVAGTVPIHDGENTTSLGFRIEGEIVDKHTRMHASHKRRGHSGRFLPAPIGSEL